MAQEELVRLEGIEKSFGSVRANRSVNLTVRRGTIHALIGENGAGKTTLMKILFGLERPDAGSIYYAGRKVEITSPQQAMALGIGMVHQHFMLVPSLTVAENVVLGHEPQQGLHLDRQAARRLVQEIATRYGLAVDPDARVRDLSVGLEQRVEIIKALSRGAELLILDEPTAVLTPQETEELFRVLKSMVAQGKTLIFISHKLKEVLAISDAITVMRAGEVVGNLKTAETNEAELARLMVGRPVLLRVEKGDARPGQPALEVRDLWVADRRGLPAVRGLSFTLRRGEILGIAGVEGNGQTELVEALSGLRSIERGEVEKDGRSLKGLSVAAIRRAGVAHIPEDRFRRGLCGQATILENMIAGEHYGMPFARRGIIDWKEAAAFTETLVKEYRIKIGSIYDPASSLSGGNAQKLVVAREFSRAADVLLVSQPTRGVDIGAIEFIHRSLVAKRDAGAAILLVSADLQEVLSLSDRILVLYEGEFTAELDPKTTSEEEIGLYMSGARRMDLRAKAGGISA
ncbi:MAG: ral nucleoside transport system ATP-binding protein [Bacillota bacterium]|nr:ral nucleoside transport system ATP-binding protein [Bacillota bacterium]MDK2882137.1 ral nucleoside transport system ATP-binding protein [Bacillota bacterium]MDK2924614.1 ral nucleoside transport system ATP-binding protein [Bacillota bacterium]